MEGLLKYELTPVRLGSSRHTNTSDWLRRGREIIGRIEGLADFNYITTVEQGLSDVRRKDQVNTLSSTRKIAIINEQENSRTKLQRYPTHITVHVSCFTLVIWIFVVEHTQRLREQNTVSNASIAIHSRRLPSSHTTPVTIAAMRNQNFDLWILLQALKKRIWWWCSLSFIKHLVKNIT